MNETLRESLLPFVESTVTSTSTTTPPLHSVLLLLFTIALETSGTLLLKHSLEDAWYLVGAYACYFTALTLFAVTLRHIPLSVAYTTWCAFGTVGVAVLSQVLYKEVISGPKWICILATVPCVSGLYILP